MSAPVAVGDVVARKYRVDRVLGQGGMGVVVAATDTQLDRRVAIKFLLPDAMKNADVVTRFAREARAAAKIHSEHVARVIDVGELDTGAPYMVMEYLEGRDLADRIRAPPAVPVADAARYVLQACEALAEAHAAGIVHRDLKPANLFLAQRPDHTVSVKVLDFGISKAPVDGGGITSTQAVMGSPHYMSPEQLMSAKHVDPRSDVWSLGVVLYETLAGMPPFQGETMPEIVAQILQSPTPSVRAVRTDVPAELEAVVVRCMAKDPGARFADVAELARALVPFAPDAAPSAERAARILGVPSTGRASGEASAPTSIAAPAGTPAEVRPDTAWGNTRAAGVPQPGRAPYVVVGVVLVAALSGGYVLLTRNGTPAPAPLAVSATRVEPSTAPAPPSAPVVLAPPAVVPDPATPSATATTARPTTGKPASPSRPPPAASVASSVPVANVPAVPPAPPPAPADPLHMGIK